MPLVADVELESGLVLNDAYLVITSFSGTKKQIDFVLSIYVNKESYNEERTALSTRVFSLDFDKDRNLFRQMYGYLLTFPEYEDAVEA